MIFLHQFVPVNLSETIRAPQESKETREIVLLIILEKEK